MIKISQRLNLNEKLDSSKCSLWSTWRLVLIIAKTIGSWWRSPSRTPFLLLLLLQAPPPLPLGIALKVKAPPCPQCTSVSWARLIDKSCLAFIKDFKAGFKASGVWQVVVALKMSRVDWVSYETYCRAALPSSTPWTCKTVFVVKHSQMTSVMKWQANRNLVLEMSGSWDNWIGRQQHHVWQWHHYQF